MLGQRRFRFTIARLSRVSDGQGGWQEGYALPADPFLAHKEEITERELAREASPENDRWVTHVLLALRNVTLKRGDKLIDSEGVEYKVHRVHRPLKRYVEIECREIVTSA